MRKSTVPVPTVIRSRQHLRAQGVKLVPAGLAAAVDLPITEDGTTYTMTQETTWLDDTHFAVGRWDGTLSIFEFSTSATTGPLITKAVNSPASEGVQMITWLAAGVFASSNDDGSLVVWSSASGRWNDLQQAALLQYDSTLGVANSGDSYLLGGILYLVVGHANGFLSIWAGNPDGTNLIQQQTVDVRSVNPVNPWGLHNVRGAAFFYCDVTNAYVVTGSEDGDLCVVRVPDGQILSRRVYNPQAQRGINSLAALSKSLLVANCAVGPGDRNLWLYTIDPTTWEITLQDSTNLVVNSGAAQVFNFCVIWALYDQGFCFFSSTEEGALWMGTVSLGQKLSIIGYQTVTTSLGAALAFATNGRLALGAYDLYEFTTLTQSAAMPPGNPERLTGLGNA